MEELGRLRHPNLIGLKAYYFARDDKLLVHEYNPNCNLFWLLHGNRAPGRTPLDWTTRLKIAAGAVRGLAFIHSSGASLRLVHGNIKSTNVLIDKLGNAKLSDYGLSVFASPSSAPKSNGYRAPKEALDSQKLTSKSDVYSYGVLLLELLTGKCPFIVFFFPRMQILSLILRKFIIVSFSSHMSVLIFCQSKYVFLMWSRFTNSAGSFQDKFSIRISPADNKSLPKLCPSSRRRKKTS